MTRSKKIIIFKPKIYTMKKIMTLAAVIGTTIAFSQNFTAGYYIVNSTAKFAVITPGGQDFDLDEAKNCYSYPTAEELMTDEGEVVIAYEVSGVKVLAFDPSGRQVVFENISSLTKAPTPAGAGICMLSENIQLLDGSELISGAYYWAIGQDVAKSTIQIQVADGKTFDVPQAKVILLGAYLKKQLKDAEFKAVGN